MDLATRRIPRHRGIAAIAAVALVLGVLAIAPSDAVEFRGLTQIVGLGSPGVVTPAALDSAAARVGGANVARIDGTDGFATAAKASVAFEPGGSVIVTTGEVYADALVASPLALALQAPMLLTARATLPEETAQALVRLAPSQVIIVGGYDAVTIGVEDAIDDLTRGTVRRVDGPNRWATAQKVSTVTHPLGADRIYVANGEEWVDALPGAMAAAAVDAPLLFVRTDTVPAETAAALTRMEPTEIIVLGGPSSVSEGLVGQLREVTPLVRRLAGEERFETAAVIAQDTWPDGAEMAFIASGASFGNALVVAPLMARRASFADATFAERAKRAAEGLATPLVEGAPPEVTTVRPEVPGGPLLLADELGFLPNLSLEVLESLDTIKEGDGSPLPTPTPTVPPVPNPGPVPNPNPGPNPGPNPNPIPNPNPGPNPGPVPNPNPGPNPGPTPPGDLGRTPIAFLDTARMVEDAATITIDVLANDYGPPGVPFNVARVSTAAQGTAAVALGGRGVTYTPNADACNDGLPPDSFTYTLAPGGGTATVQVVIDCVPDDPRAADDAFSVLRNAVTSSLRVLANDVDPEGDPFTIASTTQPANGVVAITSNGTRVSYTPTPGYCDDGDPGDTFTYTLTPGGATATVAMTVTCNNSPPVAVDDAYTIVEDAAATSFAVLANDTDAEGDPITVSSVTQPTQGVVTVQPGNTGVRYTPRADACNNGDPADEFTYTIAPGGSVALVTVSITCTQDPAVANDDSISVAQDSQATAVSARANDVDPDGDPFLIASVTQPANGTVAIIGGGTDVTYTPRAGYCNAGSAPDTFTYALDTSGDTATVTVLVACVTSTGVAANDAATVVEDASATTIDVLANDSGTDLSIASVTQPSAGTAAIGTRGASVTYTPNPNACNNGSPTDNFTYTLGGGGGTATVAVTVTCVNDTPTANDDTATVAQEAAATAILVRANDVDPENDAFTVSFVAQPANGTTSIGPGGAHVVYTPRAGYCNDGITTDDFLYRISPGTDTAIVSVTVTCVGAPAVANDDAATVVEDAAVTTIDVLANDRDADGDPFIITSTTQPTGGVVAISPGGTSLTYQPNPDFCTTGTPSTFTYTITGGDTAQVAVTVTCVNDRADAVDDTATVAEKAGPTALAVLANDRDVEGDAFSITAITQPANGTAAIAVGNASVTYQPNSSYCNTLVGGPDTFSYTVTGGDTATVSMTVTCDNDAPVAVDDDEAVDEDSGTSTLDVLANDRDDEGDPFTVGAVTKPPNGTTSIVAGGGAVTYTPAPDYCNAGAQYDTFTYTLTPGGDQGTVRVRVDCRPDLARASDDDRTVTEDSTNNLLDVLANDVDPDGDTFIVTNVTTTTNGTTSVAPGGAGVRYTPNANYCNSNGGAPATFTYTITGGATAVVRVTVTCTDDPPDAIDDAYTVVEDSATTTFSVLANDVDTEGDVITIGAVTQPAGGTTTITNGGSTIGYTPNPNHCTPGAPSTFSYTVNGGDVATVRVTVTCTPDPPDAVNDAVATGENSPTATFVLTANDTDPDGDDVEITGITTTGTLGLIALQPDNDSITYNPNGRFEALPQGGTATENMTYDVTDGTGRSDTASVVITVNGANDAPVAVADSATTTAQTPTTILVLANDSDVDTGDTFRATSVTTSPKGTATIQNNGQQIQFTPNSSACQGIPLGQTDSATVTYTITDAVGATASAAIAISITCGLVF